MLSVVSSIFFDFCRTSTVHWEGVFNTGWLFNRPVTFYFMILFFIKLNLTKALL